MPPLKVETVVKIRNYAPDFNGKIGTIISRNGELYTVQLLKITLHNIYQCELEVLK
jgi:ribosomal protein L21E